MGGSARSPRRRVEGRSAVRSAGVAIAILTAVLSVSWVPSGVASGSLWQPAGVSSLVPSTPPAARAPSIPVQFSVDPNLTFRPVPRAFWGVNGDGFGVLNYSDANHVNATPLNYVRWPGGRAADAYDPITNIIYLGNGFTYSPPTSEAKFVQWCHLVRCQAIQGLPGEIDNPTLAQTIVSYIEHTLHFHPAYWEIGNEPALWTHFGLPWLQWNTTQAAGTTPGGYAGVVQRYVAAIHAVDPSARIIGLPGVGTGSYHESLWIQATAAVNGPNISGVGIHVYPAGHLLAQNGTLSQFFGSLNSTGSLSTRLPGDLQALHSACRSCGRLRLFATEIGSGSVGTNNTGTYGAYMAGFPQIPYVATELIQALTTRWVSNFDYYALKTSYPGGLLQQNGTPRPIYLLFSRMLEHLGPVVVVSSTGSPAGGFYAVATVNATSNTLSVLFTNVNAATPYHLDLSGSGAPLGGPGQSWQWTNGTAQPLHTLWGSSIRANWRLDPMSVLLIDFRL